MTTREAIAIVRDEAIAIVRDEAANDMEAEQCAS